MNIFRHLMAVACCLLPVACLFAATPPALINYQGVLRNASGAPRTGSFDMTFRFYNLDSGGTLLLTDTHNSGAPSGQVAVANGLFTAQLGAGTITAGSEPNLAEMFRDNAAVWLEIQIAPDVLPMTPRVRVLASAYAQNAGSLQGVVNVSGTGSVGVGTSNPGAAFDARISSPANKGFIVRGAASQSANLQEWQDSSGTARSYMNANGSLFIKNNWPSIVQGETFPTMLTSLGDWYGGTSIFTIFDQSNSEPFLAVANMGYTPAEELTAQTTMDTFLVDWSIVNGLLYAGKIVLGKGQSGIMWPDVTNGASAIAYSFDTLNDLTGSAKIASFKNHGLEKAFIDNNGGVKAATGIFAGELDGSSVRAIGLGTPTSGVGVELSYGSPANSGRIVAYDRSVAQYKNLQIDGLQLHLNANSGGYVGIGTAAPSATLDVMGTVKMFDSWQTLATETEYIAASDGLVIADACSDNQGYAVLTGQTPNGTTRAHLSVQYEIQSGADLQNRCNSFIMPVRKGDTWRVFKEWGTIISGFTIFWVPLGHQAGTFADLARPILSAPGTPANDAAFMAENEGSPSHAAIAGNANSHSRTIRSTSQHLDVFPVETNVESGDVLVLNPANGDELYKCNLPADPMVVGVAADAEFRVESSELRERAGAAQLPAASYQLPPSGEGSPHLPATNYQLPGGGAMPVVVGGVTLVKADATVFPIAKGDLLTTSATPGHAMKAQPTTINGFPMFQSGTVIGKTLEDLPSGTGLIRVLVMLR